MIVEIALIIIGVILFLSVWLNVFLLRRLLSVSENLNNVLASLRDFEQHLKRVYNMEKFYGDEILNGLLEHLSETSEEITNFTDYYEGGDDSDDGNPETKTPQTN